jgi:undecaprenyl-diphosphatase
LNLEVYTLPNIDFGSIQAFAESDWAILILALMAFLESIISPIPPDPLIISMGILNPDNAILFSLIASFFSILGALVGYWLGLLFGRHFLYKFISKEKINKIEQIFNKYGVWAILIAAFTPLPYKLFAILAGVLKLDMRKFIIASIIGRAGRFIALGILVSIFGEQVQQVIAGRFMLISVIAVFAIILSFISVWILFKFKK